MRIVLFAKVAKNLFMMSSYLEQVCSSSIGKLMV